MTCSQSSLSAPQAFLWSYDRVLFVKCCLKANIKAMSRYDTAPNPANRRIVIVKISNAPGLEKKKKRKEKTTPFGVNLMRSPV